MASKQYEPHRPLPSATPVEFQTSVETLAIRPPPPTLELEFLRGVIAQAPDAIIATDNCGAITIWNDRAVAIFGFSKAEAVAGGLDLIIPERLRCKHWQGFHAAIAAGRAKTSGRSVLTRARHKDGSKLYVELSFAVLTNELGGPSGALAIARVAEKRPFNTSA